MGCSSSTGVFVARWVGPELFAGVTVNLLLALGIIIASLMHGLITAAAVIGNRVRVGTIALVNGAAQVATAWLFGAWWGLAGIAAASLVASLLVAIPAGARLLRTATGLTAAALWRDLVRPWGVRALPLLVVAGGLSAVLDRGSLWLSIALAIGVGLIYVVQMRPLLTGLPVDRRWTRWLVSLRVLPAPAVQAAAAGQG